MAVEVSGHDVPASKPPMDHLPPTAADLASQGWVPGLWWRVVRDVPTVTVRDIYAETGDEEEARRRLARCPYPARLERLWSRTYRRWETAE